MLPRGANREEILDQLEALGGLSPENVRRVSRSSGVPEADVYGVATFYHLLSRPAVERRVCQGLSCWLAGSERTLAELSEAGIAVEAVSCLGQCDRPTPQLGHRGELLAPEPRGRVTPDDPALPINLGGADAADYRALAAARQMGAEAFLEQLERSGLQGRGGAGFPAHIKWRSVRGQPVTERTVVCNADEGEPGTFKDREIMLRRPHRLLEGLAIAAEVVQAAEIIIYIRGEFRECRRSLEAALAIARPHLGETTVRFVLGHGAYICGEETALLEALEGRRGMPRLKPPFPTESGYQGRPTLVNNVETLACVSEIALRGGDWFRALGRREAGTKLYCVSGHVRHAGVYELPLGVTLDELVAAAGGYHGRPMAFSPGGASSGFLPMSSRDLPLDFRSLAEVGSMLGSAGVVVLNDTIDIARAAWWQAIFFEDESCGQCAPCRIGARLTRRAIGRYLDSGDPSHLRHLADIGWEMEEGSICGLGVAAPIPIRSAMQHFPESFRPRAHAPNPSGQEPR